MPASLLYQAPWPNPQRSRHSSSLTTGSMEESLVAQRSFLIATSSFPFLMATLHGCLLLQPTWLLSHYRPRGGQNPLLFQTVLILNSDPELPMWPYIWRFLQAASLPVALIFTFIWLPSLVRARVTHWCRGLRLPWLCHESEYILKVMYTFYLGQ